MSSVETGHFTDLLLIRFAMGPIVHSLFTFRIHIKEHSMAFRVDFAWSIVEDFEAYVLYIPRHTVRCWLNVYTKMLLGILNCHIITSPAVIDDN